MEQWKQKIKCNKMKKKISKILNFLNENYPPHAI